MPIRYAAAVGIAAVVAAIGAFLLIPQHLILGTNKIGPIVPVIDLEAEAQACERVPSVPAGAGFVRLGVGQTEPATLRVLLEDSGRPIGSGTATDVVGGTVAVRLDRPTPAAANARLCVLNLGGGPVSLFGEPPLRNGVRVPTMGITFLEAGSSSWLSRLGEIETRYGYAHAGAIGTWAVWVAGFLAAAAAILAFGLMTREAGRT
jgi:hypothetical protein